jgi:hypothetical protein
MMEKALQPLMGLPLNSMARAADMEMFDFGRSREITTRKGQKKTVGEWVLHVQCAWRLTHSNRVVIGRNDLYYPPGDPHAELEGWSPVMNGDNSRLDEITKQLLAAWSTSPPVVDGVCADALGGFRLSFTNGYVLEVWPHNSVDGEDWRVFQPQRDTPHFVVPDDSWHG